MTGFRRNRRQNGRRGAASLGAAALLALATAPAPAHAGWVRCDSLAAGSAEGGAAASIRIENATTGPLALFRVDAAGRAVRRATLAPGAAPELDGRIGELWFVAGNGGACRNALRIERAGEYFQLYD